MRGILALAAIMMAVTLNTALASAKTTGACTPPTISNIHWSWEDTGMLGTQGLNVFGSLSPHGTEGTLYAYENAPHPDRYSLYIDYEPYFLDATKFEISGGDFYQFRKNERPTITITYENDCGSSGILATFKAVGWKPGKLASSYQQTPVAPQSQAIVGMPFDGKWAYNVPVKPVNGKYNDVTSSHPSVHAAPGGGDWATDLYAPVGEPVKLHVSSSGNLGFSWLSSSGCPSSTKIEVKVNGQPVGWIYYTHLAGAVRSGPIKNGMTLGTVANPATDGGCNPGHHVHIELKNARSGTYACWTDHGLPGTAVLSEGTSLGVLGSSNKAKRQKCSIAPAAISKPETSTTPQTGNSPPATVAADKWPIHAGKGPISLQVYLSIRFKYPEWAKCDDRYCVAGVDAKVYVYLRKGGHRYTGIGNVSIKHDPRDALIKMDMPGSSINHLLVR